MSRYSGFIFWAVLLAGVFLFLKFYANRAIYYPMRYPAGWWEARDQLGAIDVDLRTPDGVRLHGWWVPSPGSPLATLYLHGNAGNVTHRGFHMQEIRAAGSGVLVIDYRGYGKSEGSPSEEGLYHDATAGYEHLRAQGYPPERIILHGESLGCSVAVDLAARVPCGGIILEAPFSSASAVAATVLPLIGPMLVRSYDSIVKIGKVRAPKLFIHGDRDEVIPMRLGRELFDHTPEPKTWWQVPGAHHNDLAEKAGREYRERLRAFYAKRGQ